MRKVDWLESLAVLLLAGALIGIFFHWEMMNGLAFLFDLLGLVFILGLVVCAISCLVRVLRKVRSVGMRALIPLGLCLTTIVVLIALPERVDHWRIARNFLSTKNRRQQVVEMWRSGKLNAGENIGGSSRAELPKEYSDLAFDHRVAIFDFKEKSKQQLYFRRYAGCMGDCGGGYMYVSNSESPETPPDASAIDAEKLEDHWYWVTQH